MATSTTFGLVGSGWRARFYLELARLLPERLRVAGVVTRRQESAAEVARHWNVPTFLSIDELVQREHPDFVVTCVSREANPGLLEALVEVGQPVLSETPPAADLEGLRSLWDRIGARGLVQVAEQYPVFPGHAARRELVRRRVFGEPTSVQVSSTHDYHAIALMRALLDVGFGPTVVSAHSFVAPLVDTSSRAGWTGDATPKDAATTIATIDFGRAMGLYDFTDNQWHNQLRMRRLVIRGSAGEMVDNEVVRLGGPRTIVNSALIRRQTGYDLDLDGYDTDHLSFEGEVVYRNPFIGLRLADEEIGIATVLTQMGAWCADEGPAPYPLAEGCQDHLISLAIHASTASESPVTTNVEAWGGAGAWPDFRRS